MAGLDDLLKKIPPHNLEAERAVLGACLFEPGALERTQGLLVTTDFYKDHHRRIFDVMTALDKAGQVVDVITVGDGLRREAALEEIGGPAYLAQLTDEATTLSQIPSYCAIVAEKARAREIIRIGSDLVGQAFEQERPTLELISTGAGLLEALARRATPTLEAFPAMSIGELARLNIPDPTFHVHGWIPSKALSFIVGDSEAYKSWFALLLAMSVAAGASFLERFPTVQAPTMVISEENGMSEDKRRSVLLGRGHGLNLDEIPCHIASEAAFSFDDPVRYAALRRYVDQHRIEMVVMDSFVRVHRRKENDAGEMNALYLDRMKPMIRDGIALVFLHHRRKAQVGPGQQPVGDSDEIRGSGDIRAATHSVLFLRTVSDTQVLVRHNKTRGWRRQEPFVFAVQDPDRGATALVWEGAPKDALDKSGACQQAILELAAKQGAFTRAELAPLFKGKFSRKLYDEILKVLSEKGTPLKKEKLGSKKGDRYTYVPQGADEPGSDPEELPF